MDRPNLPTFPTRSLEDRSRRRRQRFTEDKLVKIRTEHNNVGAFKTMLAALVILIQLGIIIALSFLPATIALVWYLAVMFVISVFTAISVMSSHRNTQAKAVWVLFILLFFFCGFIIYFMSNDKYMYARARRRHREIFARSEHFLPEHTAVNASDEMAHMCAYLNSAGNFRSYNNTRLNYFSSGAQLFDDVIESLKGAQSFVFIEYYAVSDGVLISRIWDVLEEKIKQGVDVRMIYDDVGSRAFSHAMRKKMRAAGAQVRVFNRLLSRFTFAMNYRDHRKIIVIDGKIAYTGGSNVADEYINEKHMHGYWKDTGLRIEGEAVDSFTLFFLRQWEFITNKKCEYIPYMGHYERFSSPYVAAPYVDGPEYELTICKSVFENVISSARERLYIMTPYFIPDDSVTQCIINKALSGVDVRIILPSVPDKYYVYLVTRDNAEKLIKHGVKIYYLCDSFVHSKLAINETCAVVGTVNFDMRSFYQQFEDALLTDDQNVLAQINADFENTFPDCDNPQKPAKNGLVKTVAIALLRLVSPLM